MFRKGVGYDSRKLIESTRGMVFEKSPHCLLHIASQVTEPTAFERASKAWDAGQLRRAFRLFLEAAEAGDESCQLNVGYFYDAGIGVRRNPEQALQWYRRAHKRGNTSAANNIGTILRDRGEAQRALAWFERAVAGGEDDSHLEIARLLAAAGKKRRAISHLNRIERSKSVTNETRRLAKKELNALCRRDEVGHEHRGRRAGATGSSRKQKRSRPL